MPKINLDGGRLEMDTDATAAAMNSLAQHGADFENLYRAAADLIAANEDAIGRHHKLCAQFRTNYEATAKSLRESVTNVKTTFVAFADGGRGQINEYVRVDREYSEEIRRSGRKA
jgi:hypothetical protein